MGRQHSVEEASLQGTMVKGQRQRQREGRRDKDFLPPFPGVGWNEFKAVPVLSLWVLVPSWHPGRHGTDTLLPDPPHGPGLRLLFYS